MAIRIGKNEIELLTYLSINPRSRHVDITNYLQEDKGNITHRLQRLKKKNLIMVESGKKWSLTTYGFETIISLGADVKPILKNYWYRDDWINQLKETDEILTRELSFWGKDRNKILGKMFLAFNTLDSTGLLSEQVIRNVVAGMFQDYFDEKMRTKQMTQKDFRRIHGSIVSYFGVKNLGRKIGYDKYL